MTHHHAILRCPDRAPGGPLVELLFPDDRDGWVPRWQAVHAGRVRPPRGIITTPREVALACAWLLWVSGAAPGDPEAIWPDQRDRDALWGFWFEAGDPVMRELQHAILLASRDASPETRRPVVEGALTGMGWSSARGLEELEPAERRLALELLLDGVLLDLEELDPGPRATTLATLHPSPRLLALWSLTGALWPERFDRLLTLQLTPPLRGGYLSPDVTATYDLLVCLPPARRQAILDHPEAPPPTSVAPANLTCAPTAERARVVFDGMGPLAAHLSVSSSAFHLTRLIGAAAQMGEPLRQLLRARMTGDAAVSLRQARLLRAMADPSLLEPLLWLLGHEDERLRHEAARGLGHLGPGVALQALQERWARLARSAQARRAAFLEGAARVLVWWRAEAPEEVGDVVARWLAEERAAALRGRLERLRAEPPDPWFAVEERFWRVLLRCCAGPALRGLEAHGRLVAEALGEAGPREVMTHVMGLYTTRRFAVAALFREPLRAAFASHGGDRFAHVAWLELSLSLPDSFERNLALLQGSVLLDADAWRDLLVHRLLHGTLHGESDIYEAVHAQQGVPRRLHLDMLQHRLQSLRDFAARSLAADPGAIPDVAERLTHRLVSVRASAAVSLQLSGSPEAVAPLQAALLGERTKSGQRALRRALEALAPDLYRGDPSARYGVYTREEPGAVNDLLEQLRGLAHGPPSELAWVRAVDVLERLRQHDALGLGADYLRDAELTRQPDSVQPIHWGELPEVADIGLTPQVDHPTWIPVAALFEATGRDAFIDRCVRRVGAAPGSEELPRGLQRAARHLQDNADALLLGWIERGWAWCVDHGLSTDALRVELFTPPARIDGQRELHRVGLELWRGFGVRLGLSRHGLMWRSEEGSGSLLHRVRARVGPRHPLRDDAALRRWVTQGYVDVKAALEAQG